LTNGATENKPPMDSDRKVIVTGKAETVR